MKFGALIVLIFALAACGCGGGRKTASQPPQTPATTPSTPAATPSTAAGAPTTSTGTSPGARTEPPSANGGEEPIRTPATYTFLRGGRVSPPTITVPAFIAVEITLASRDGRAHDLVLTAGRAYRLHVAAGRRSTVRVPGLRAGTYRLVGAPGATLVVGGEAGP